MTTPTTTSDRARQAAGLPPNGGKELTRFDQARDARIADVRNMLPAFADAMRNELQAKRLVRDAITAIRTVPKLVEATRESFLGSLMLSAQLDLRPNVSALGHCWVLPYKDNRRNVTVAQFVLGYRGMTTLGWRSGLAIEADTVYANEKFQIQRGTDPRVWHVPILDSGERGVPIAHIAYARAATGQVWRAIGHDDALAAREKSPSYKGGGDSPWRHDEENGWPMCRKTVVRRLFPYVPTDSPELAMAIAADDKTITLDEASMETTTEDGDVVEPASYADDARETITVTQGKQGTEQPTKAAPRRGRRKPTGDDGGALPDATTSGPTPEDIAELNAEAAAQAAEADAARQDPLRGLGG